MKGSLAIASMMLGGIINAAIEAAYPASDPTLRFIVAAAVFAGCIVLIGKAPGKVTR
jgi:hypothetical protein